MNAETLEMARAARRRDDGGERVFGLDDGGDEMLVEVRETISADRALVVTDFAPPEITPGERLVRFAYRLGVPGAVLDKPFRKPARPRLLATVESPLEGERAAGVALRAGHFLVHGVKTPIGQVDFGPTAKLTPPVERTVHGFTWLRDLDACAPRPQCTGVAERLSLIHI